MDRVVMECVRRFGDGGMAIRPKGETGWDEFDNGEGADSQLFSVTQGDNRDEVFKWSEGFEKIGEEEIEGLPGGDGSTAESGSETTGAVEG